MSNFVKDVESGKNEITWSTTPAPFTPEEEDAIVTLVVVVVGIIAAIVILFSMGVFIDCRHQKKDSIKRNKLKLKMPQIPRRENRYQRDDTKTLTTDMCPSTLESGTITEDAIV